MLYNLLVLSSALFFKFSLGEQYNASACICTTVPCPVSGANYLTEGGGGTGTYYYSTHNGYPVVTSASFTLTRANLDKVCSNHVVI
jgi:hypothetical protein